jgi:hypothetical protein
MKEQRKIAGQKSADKRRGIEISTTVQQPFNDRSTKERKVKESKEKESKVNEIKEEYSLVEMLSPYIADLGIEYTNFYSYWSEKNNKGKERWQVEKFFDISRRINTWLTNANKFSNNGNTTEKLGTSAARMEALRKW